MIARKKSKHDSMGFSLIELLVVIAVILLLARMLLPSLDKARETGLKVQCASNLHQIGVALAVSIHDGNTYPHTSETNGDGTLQYINNSTWNTATSCAPTNGTNGCNFAKYVNPSGRVCEKSVYWCPSFTNNCKMPYMGNYSIGGRIPSEIKNLSGVFFLVEEKESNETVDPIPSEPTCAGPYTGGSNCGDNNMHCGCGRAETASKRHNGTSNALFLDGHVKSARQSVINGDMNNERGCWNPYGVFTTVSAFH